MLDIVWFAALIALSAFFAAAETALTAVSPLHIAHLIEKKKAGAKSLHRLRENPARMLSTILVGNNIVNISASVIATTIVTDYFQRLGLQQEGMIIGIAIGLMTLFVLVFGEITPKTVAIRNAERLSLLFSPPLLVFEWILSPIAWLTTLISRPFIFIFGGRIPEQGPFVTEEEIKLLLLAGEREGVIEHEEREMISSVFRFGDLTATEVMTPRDKITCVEAGDTVGEAIARIKESGHSRLPVIDQSLNNIIGIVFAKDLLEVNASERISEHLRQAIFIPGRKKISDLMEQMQAEYKHLAIVVDEFGHTLGLVTLEDLVEEIVGEIHDEYEKRK